MPDLNNRFFALDGLRGIAAIFVLLYHVEASTKGLTGFAPGYIMVDIFFVISGFVLSARYGDFNTSTALFCTDRLSRLYPLHILTLLTLLIIEIILFTTQGIHAVIEQQIVWTFVLNIFLMQCIGLTTTPSWNTSSWSISVEFWWNIAWYWLGKNRWLQSTFVHAFLWLICTIALTTSFTTIDKHIESIGFANVGILRCIIGFSAGTMIYRYRKFLIIITSIPAEFIIWISFVLLWIIALVPTANWANRADFALGIFLAPCIVIAGIGNGFTKKIFSTRLFVFFGKISYSVYMWHLIVIKMMNYLVAENSILKVTAMIFGTLIVSIFSYYALEIPTQRWSRKLTNRFMLRHEAIKESTLAVNI